MQSITHKYTISILHTSVGDFFFKITSFFFVLKMFEEPMKECCWNMLSCVDGDYSNHFRSS